MLAFESGRGNQARDGEASPRLLFLVCGLFVVIHAGVVVMVAVTAVIIVATLAVSVNSVVTLNCPGRFLQSSELSAAVFYLGGDPPRGEDTGGKLNGEDGTADLVLLLWAVLPRAVS